MYIASNGMKTAVICRDPEPFSPRDPEYQENLGTMVCWHRRHNLGDQHDFTSPSEFAIEMASKHVSQKNVMSALVNGEFADFRVHQNSADDNYSVEAKIGLIPGKERWVEMDWAIAKDTFEVIEGEATFDLEEDVLGNCYPDELLRLCEKCGDVAILPLFLYDHSGLAMSTGSFVGRAHHAEWDSGQVGYIYMTKDTAMKELAMEGDTLRVAMVFPNEMQDEIRMRQGDFNAPVDSAMKAAGYTLVAPEAVRNLYDPNLSPIMNQPVLNPDSLEKGLIFKKDRTLYEFDGWNEDGTFNIRSIASFNPDLKPLTEETWKARAEKVLAGEVKDYDNYLQGEIYGYELYEGLDQVDSCWGFNPGAKDIRDLMKWELGDFLERGMKFDLHLGDEDFNIEEFLEENEFPGFWDKLTEEVKAYVTFESETSQVYPFGVPAEDILSNKDDILDNIVKDLYEEHLEPDTDRIHEVIQNHAGVSREVQPKLSAKDLDPERDYTAEEIMDLFKKKPSLADQISGAAARQAMQAKGQDAPEHSRER